MTMRFSGRVLTACILVAGVSFSGNMTAHAELRINPYPMTHNQQNHKVDRPVQKRIVSELNAPQSLFQKPVQSNQYHYQVSHQPQQLEEISDETYFPVHLYSRPGDVVRWEAPQGAPLKSVLEGWSSRHGVELVWQEGADFMVRDSLYMEGSYENAVRALLDQHKNMQFRPVGNLHIDGQNGRKTLVIQSNKAG